MKITYTNTYGNVVFSGGGSDGDFMLTTISGLDLPDKDRTLASYAGRDGVTARAQQYGQRIITVGGDLADADAKRETIRHAMHVLSKKGTLKLESENKVREITADCASFTLGEKKGNYQIFAAQFTCDFPHFTDGGVQIQPLYARINQIQSDRVLPYVFTRRIGNDNIIITNPGDVDVEPVIIFEGVSPASAEGTLVVENKTTGKTMTMEYALQAGEILRVDVPARTITSSINGDVIGCMSRDSFFADIHFVPGQNNLAITGTGANVNMCVAVEYSPLYVEAVM